MNLNQIVVGKIFSEIYFDSYQDIAPSLIPSVQGSSYPANTGAVNNVLKNKSLKIWFFIFLVVRLFVLKLLVLTDLSDSKSKTCMKLIYGKE